QVATFNGNLSFQASQTRASGSGSSSLQTSQIALSPDGRTVATTQTGTSSTSARFPSPLNDPGQLKQLLPILLDQTTTSRAPELPARININSAPQAVLAALPGLTDADVQNILSRRPDPLSSEVPDPIFQTPAWLITEASLRPQTLSTLDRYITARSQVY